MALPPPRMIYLSRARLHRPRANLIQTLHTAEAFQRLGIDVTLYFAPHKSDKSCAELLAEFGINTPLDIRFSPLLHSGLKLWPFVLIHRRALLAADMVFVRSVELSQVLARLRVPHVLEIHDAYVSLIRKGYLESIVARQRSGMIRFVVAISHAVERVLIDAGANPSRVHVAPSGVEVEDFSGIPLPDPSAFAHPRVVYIGSISRSRGLEVFVRLVERGVADVTLVGAREDDVPRLSGLRCIPYVPHREVPGWYAKGDIAVMPYQADLGHANSISPIKVFEAMAAGRPIVVSDLPAIRELIKHEQNGLLVPPDDLDAWVAAVERLRHEPELALGLARAGRETVGQFSWERRARGIADAYGWPMKD